MAGIDVFGGILKGFGNQLALNRAEQARQTEAQMGRDQRIFEELAKSDDPEIQGAAISGLSSLATGSYKPTKGLSKYLGGDIQVNPAITRVFQMLRNGGFAGFGPGDAYHGDAADAGDGPPLPPAGTGALGSSAVPAPTASAAGGAAPTRAIPGSAGMAPSPSAPGGGIKLPAALSVAQGPAGAGAPPPSPVTMPSVTLGPPPPPGRSGPGAVQTGVGGATFDAATVAPPPAPPAPPTGGPAAGPIAAAGPVGAPPAPPQRRVFVSPEERVHRDAVARAQSVPEGEVAGLEAVGVPHAEAVEIVKQKMIRAARGGAGGGFQSIGGQMPDGSLVFASYNRGTGQYMDPNTQQPLVGFKPRLTSASASLGEVNEMAARMLGYANAAEAGQQGAATEVNALGMKLRQDAAFASGTGSGDAAVQTKLKEPIGVTAGAAQGLDPTVALGELGGITPITPEQKDRVETAKSLVGKLANVRALIQRVFPPGSGLVGGLTAGAVLAGKRASRDPDLRALEAALGPLKSIVARTIALEKGNLSQGDVSRSEIALPEIDALLGADSQESALRVIDELDGTAQAVVQAIKTPADQLAGKRAGQAGAGGVGQASPAGVPKVGDVVGNLYTGARLGHLPNGSTIGEVDGRQVPLTKGPDGKWYY